MKAIKFLALTLFTLVFSSQIINGQNFTRSELNTELDIPWEIQYGPDEMLYITVSGGKVIRVNPNNGDGEVIFTAPDYYDGHESESLSLCDNPKIGSGTLGLALHPNFEEKENAYIYFVHSYNQGTENNPETNFLVKRLTWDHDLQTVTDYENIITEIPSGHDHLGGRLIATTEKGKNYLYLSVGDLGISEDNAPDCYQPQSENPNNFTQNPFTKNGKIHRFNIDGSIPSDNPIANNSFYTRGHRNPQGLVYNPKNNLIYDIEHGDRTDDEINLLIKGMNYGWKQVRGFHNDNSFDGESEFVKNYEAHPDIEKDKLTEPIHSWCTIPPTSGTYLDWCTVAPSDAEYYPYNIIPNWNHSLFMVTLKNGKNTDMEVQQLKLSEDGKSIIGSPTPFFAEDQDKNGRLRDICFSNDGKKIFLINNWGTDRHKITVYEYQSNSIAENDTNKPSLYPNPAKNSFEIKNNYTPVNFIHIYDNLGKKVYEKVNPKGVMKIEHLPSGVYNVLVSSTQKQHRLKLIKH